MIFVAVGTQKFQFDRLLKAIDKLVASGEINEKVFAQRGACVYVPHHYPSKSFLEQDVLRKEIEQSDIVITHGGTGIILTAIKMGKRVIAVPRLAKYKEHVDNHQIELITQFVKNNLICTCEDFKYLGQLVNEIREKTFNSCGSNGQVYINTIDAYIRTINKN